MFFIQDPFTETVKGPVTAEDLRKLFAQGGHETWGVSKSRNGPWTPLAKVRGIAPTTPPPKVEQPAPIPKPAEVVANNSVRNSPSRTSADQIQACVDQIKALRSLLLRYWPKSLIARIGVVIVGGYLALMVLFGIGVWWSETYGVGARAREALIEAQEGARRTMDALERVGGDAYRDSVIRDSEYERAKRERLGR